MSFQSCMIFSSVEHKSCSETFPIMQDFFMSLKDMIPGFFMISTMAHFTEFYKNYQH